MLLQLTEHGDVPVSSQYGLKERLLRCIEETGGTGQFLADVRLMGMQYDAPYGKFRMSYYVGTDWIDKRAKLAMIVRPKIKGLDFQQMLMQCFRCPEASEDLDKVFYIRTEDEPIEVDADDFQIEPLLLVFFLNLLQRIVRRGLKSDYVRREERLDGKLKGKIQMNRYLTQGIAMGRRDRVNCSFEEYSTDCLENRVLKRALGLVQTVLQRVHDGLGSQAPTLDSMYQNCVVAFQNVSDEISLQDLNRLHVHPMYKDYRAIMPLAKMIIRKQGYCVGQDVLTGKQMFPPFIIDMPILFERYVYSLLLERYGNRTIGYQVAVGGNILDFTKADEQMILDTKYKPQWEDGVDHDNARQLSGYARHTNVRKRLGVTDDKFICPCVIIYPSGEGVADFAKAPDRLLHSAEEGFTAFEQLPEYLRFYKMGVRLPLKTP